MASVTKKDNIFFYNPAEFWKSWISLPSVENASAARLGFASPHFTGFQVGLSSSLITLDFFRTNIIFRRIHSQQWNFSPWHHWKLQLFGSVPVHFCFLKPHCCCCERSYLSSLPHQKISIVVNSSIVLKVMVNQFVSFNLRTALSIRSFHYKYVNFKKK